MPELRQRPRPQSRRNGFCDTSLVISDSETDGVATKHTARTHSKIRKEQIYDSAAKSNGNQIVQSRRQPATATMKRRRTVLDEEEEEDDVTPKTGKAEIPARRLQKLTRGEDAETQLVLLSVKISGSSFIKFAVDETIIRKIPDYADILQSVKTQSTGDKRLQIIDSKIRNEESMTRVIEFLTNGKLAPINLSSAQASLESLYELINLYDLSVNLALYKLECAIKKHIDDCDDLDLGVFVQFAAECYNMDTGHRVKEDSILGQYIKRTLTDYLRKLIYTGLAEKIKNAGGTLSKQFTEVLMNNYIKNVRP